MSRHKRLSLREARERAGLSREAVTRLMNPPISSKTLERMEKGSAPVTRDRIRQLAAIYELEPGRIAA